MALPSPLIPNAANWIDSYNTGFDRGEAMRRRNLLLEAGALAASAPAMSAPAVAPVAAASGSLGDRIRMAESGGRVDARNPNSSAYGPDQFIASTWLDVLKRNRPDIAAGKSDNELLALRSNAELSGAMRDAYTAENQNALRSADLPVTDGTSYLSHFAGAGGARNVLRADPATPVAQILQPSAVRANPFLQGMTTGDLRAWADRKAGVGGAQPASAPAVPVADPDSGLRAASNALLRGGELQAGLGIQNTLFERSEKARAQAEAKEKERVAMIGEMALRADTPEKWARAVEVARRGGLNVNGLEDFSSRELVLARAGKSMDYMSAGKNGVFNKTLGRYEPRDPNAPVDAESLSKQGTIVQDADGNYQIAQLSESGDPRIAKFPEGYKVLPPSFTVDSGLSHDIRARAGGGSLGSVPKNVTGEAEQKKTGEMQATRAMERPEANSKVGTAISNLERLEQEANAIKDLPGLASNYGMMGVIRNRPGGSAADADARLKTLKSQITTNVLQAMREASKTGGALGNASDRDMALLESNIASLENAQSYSSVKSALERIARFAQFSKARISRAYREAYGEDFAPAQIDESAGPVVPTSPSGGALDDARAAISRGAPRDAVIQRLRENGIDPSGL